MTLNFFRYLDSKRKRINFTKKIACLGIGLIICGCSQATTQSKPDDWADERDVVSSGKYETVVLADLDNDGNIDVAGGASFPETVGIYYGDGQGKMSDPQFLSFKGHVKSITAADVNNDGLKDLIFTVQRRAWGVMVWMNQGGRKWKLGENPVEANKYQGLVAVDIDQDGNMDVVAANATSEGEGGIQAWLGNGKGGWRLETGPTVTGIYMDVALADFNKDGFVDLAATGWGPSGTLRVWLGNGRGGWSSLAPVAKGSFYELTAADINGDGQLDLLTGTYRQGIRIFHGDGKGGFAEKSSPVAEGSFWKVIAVDLNQDKKLDLLAGSIDASGVKAWANGSVIWSSITERFPSVGTFYGMDIADINNDGVEDICAAAFGEGIKFWSGKLLAGFSLSDISPKKKKSAEEDAESAEVEKNNVFTSAAGYPEYRVGPGDILAIKTWEQTTSVVEHVPVAANGKISYGFVEDLDVDGLTLSQIDAKLTKKFKEYVRSPRIDVGIRTHNSKFVTLLGAIRVNPNFKSGPGEYVLTGKKRVLEMLTGAGGPRDDANLQDVQIRSKDGRAFTVDLVRSIIQGDISQNNILDDGDVVFVPTISKEAKRVYVFGEVGSPGSYQYTESDLSLIDAISRAGGVTIFSAEKDTKIIRGDPTKPVVLAANVNALMTEGDHTQNIALKNGDIVYVPRTIIGDVNALLKQIAPILAVLQTPAQFMDLPGSFRTKYVEGYKTFGRSPMTWYEAWEENIDEDNNDNN